MYLKKYNACISTTTYNCALKFLRKRHFLLFLYCGQFGEDFNDVVEGFPARIFKPIFKL